jgi:hypothetical protein
MSRSVFYVLGVGLLGLVLYSQQPRRQTVGPQPEGGFLLNTGWRIRPAGTKIPLSTLPMSAALAPDGRMMAALNGGYLPSSVDLLDMEVTVQAGCGRQLKKVFKILQLDLDIA